MTQKAHSVFVDTSVIFAAVVSPSGGARKLFQLGEIGILQLMVGPNVLREIENVLKRKAPASLPTLALLMDAARVVTCQAPTEQEISTARKLVGYEPDAYVLAEALCAGTEWFVTHDKEHFLSTDQLTGLTIRVGNPGDVIRSIKDELGAD